MEKIKSIHREQLALNASATGTVNLTTVLPESGFLRSIALQMTATVSTAASNTNTDGMVRLFDAIRVKANRNNFFCDVHGRRLFELNEYDYGVAPRYDALTNSLSSQVKRANLLVDFAIDPRNPLDASTVIPLEALDSVVLEVSQQVPATALGSTGSIAAGGTIDVILETIELSKAEAEKIWPRGSPFKLTISEKNKGITVAGTNYSNYLEYPSGNTVKDVLIWTELTASPNTPTDNETTQFRVMDTQTKQQLFENTFYGAVADDVREHSIAPTYGGAFMIDHIANNGVGLSLENKRSGVVQFQFSNSATNFTIYAVFREIV